MSIPRITRNERRMSARHKLESNQSAQRTPKSSIPYVKIQSKLRKSTREQTKSDRKPVSIREWRELPACVYSTNKKIVEYLVKWRGAGPHYTWETSKALPKDMIDRFRSIKSILLKAKPFAVTVNEFFKFGRQTVDFVANVQKYRKQQSAPSSTPKTPSDNHQEEECTGGDCPITSFGPRSSETGIPNL